MNSARFLDSAGRLLQAPRPVIDRRRRNRARRWWVRRLALLLPLVLVFCVIGQGHVFQSLGVEIACADVDGPEAEPANTGDAPEEQERSGKHSHHCPPDCPRCPCGHIPVLASFYAPVVTAMLDFLELPAWPSLADRRTLCDPNRFERPPRLAAA